ncbi:SH3 domain-containing protein [Ulvibacter antarcticus]|uniref:SH3 domain-containing protein n=1 Tax=Ulvibacter antarcticus TaxID=442714 RepID=A0A3L9YZG6_9FLAO|nr:SH3 domain-containing protein [Ulvibacter antarcticus]RMA66101.1 SH3 domain-containing protein [Ulvibacter antarcticus]
MKKVVFSILAVALIFVSCKSETKEVQPLATAADIALADTASEMSSPEFLYVTAYSGLSLREFNNLNSERVAKMPYGTKVKVISSENNNTMTVGGIKGAMDEIEFNHKKGFAFNGYLSKFFPPEKNSKAKGYADDLKALFPSVVYSESVGGTASKPINIETLELPTDQWHEAFFVAQRLFDFPKDFAFPNPTGKDEQVIKDKMPEKDVWTSELIVNRKDDALTKIAYHYKTKNFGYDVTITQNGDKMKIEKTETVE